MSTVFIYALASTRDGGRLPWYVGQTVNPGERLYNHTRDAYKDPQVRSTKHSIWIRQEIDAGFQIVTRFLAECATGAEADLAEIHWIETLRKVNPLLVNTHRGNHNKGRAARLKRVANETRARLELDKDWLAELLTKETV